MTAEQVDKLINFGQMALEQGWHDQARGYFEQALALDATNQEAMKGLARANEILSRWKPMPAESTQAEPVEPLRKGYLEPTKPEVEPAEPKRMGELATKRKGGKRWLALVVVPVVLLAVVFAYPRVMPVLFPTPTPMPTSTVTPWPTSTPRPTPTLRSGEKYECEQAAVGSNGAVTIELFSIGFGRRWADVQLSAVNISSHVVYIGPASFILVDSTGASVNYYSGHFGGRSTGTDLAPGTYTTGGIDFAPCVGEPRRLVYDGGLYGTITLNISLESCVRVKR
jgi:hypothetical protein